MDSKQSSVMGGIFAIPWCCIIPSGLSLLGLAGVSFAREVTVAFTPYLLAVSVLFLGRAHYLFYVKHQGNGVSHIVIWVSTVLALTLFGLR